MMQAFHNSNTVKEKYLNRVISHRQADEIVQGTYWKDGKGCAVGCTIHSTDHGTYDQILCIPSWLEMLEDKIFEGMSLDNAIEFPEKFLSAIPVGFSNWDKVWHEWCTYLINTFVDTRYPEIKSTVDWILKLHKNPETGRFQWIDARDEVRKIIDNLTELYGIRRSSGSMDSHIVERLDCIIKTAKILQNATIQGHRLEITAFETTSHDAKTGESNRNKVSEKCATKLLEILESQK